MAFIKKFLIKRSKYKIRIRDYNEPLQGNQDPLVLRRGYARKNTVTIILGQRFCVLAATSVIF